MHETAAILLSLFVIFVAAQIGAEIAQRLKLPGVVGEIAAGCVIGPSALGWITAEQIVPGTPLEVLAEIGAGETPQLLVMNKSDRLESLEEAGVLAQRILAQPHDGESREPVRAALVSARTGAGFDRLFSLLDATLPFDTVKIEKFQIPLSAGADIALLHSAARVIREEYNESLCEIEAEVPESIRRRLARYVVAADTVRN